MAFIAPYETFSTADEDLFIAAANDNLFRVLVEVLGIDDLASDPRFSSNPQRVVNRVELHRLIEARLKQRPARDWESRLLDASIPCSRIQTIADLVSDPQFLAVEMLSNLPHPLIPDLQLLDLPVSRDGKRTQHRLAPPAVGGQTDEILREMGYDDERIESLRQLGVVN